MKRQIFYILKVVLLLLVVSIPAILPYFHKGYFPTHDGEWAVVRLADMFRIIKDGQIPARFSGNLNFGYGYPLFNFAYPFPYYLGIIFYFLGFGFIGSIKAIFALSVPISAIFMYFLSKKVWRNAIAGIVSSMLYIYLPYRFVDLYVRGSIGESISFALFPLLLLLLYKTYEEKNELKYVLFGSIIFAIQILAHNIMALLFAPVAIAFAFMLSYWSKKKILPLITVFIGGVSLASFFWMPALFEKKYILLSKIPIANRNLYFLSLKKLLLPSWGYAPPTNIDGFSYQIGIAHILVFILAVFYIVNLLISRKLNVKKQVHIIIFWIVLMAFAILFLLFPQSKFIWENAPLLSEINYPWTLLAPLGFLISFLSGFLAVLSKQSKAIAVVLAIIGFLVSAQYAKPEKYIDKGDNFYITNDATTTSSHELMPLWVKRLPDKRYVKKAEVINRAGSILNLAFNSKETVFTADMADSGSAIVNTIYYPGWNAFVDGRKAKIAFNNNKGIMEINLPKGIHTIRFIFSETKIRLIADLISLIAFVLIFSLFIWNLLKRIGAY